MAEAAFLAGLFAGGGLAFGVAIAALRPDRPYLWTLRPKPGERTRAVGVYGWTEPE